MKIRNNKGFTLTETLLTVILVVLMSGAVAAGVSTVSRVIHKIQNKANAEVLLSTTLTLLSDDLQNTESVESTDGTVQYLKIRENGSSAWISIDNSTSDLDSENAGIRKNYYTMTMDSNSGIPVYQDTGLSMTYVTEQAKTDTLYTTIDSITYSNHVLTVHDLEVKNKDGVTQEKLDSFSVAALKVE